MFADTQCDSTFVSHYAPAPALQASFGTPNSLAWNRDKTQLYLGDSGVNPNYSPGICGIPVRVFTFSGPKTLTMSDLGLYNLAVQTFTFPPSFVFTLYTQDPTFGVMIDPSTGGLYTLGLAQLYRLAIAPAPPPPSPPSPPHRVYASSFVPCWNVAHQYVCPLCRPSPRQRRTDDLDLCRRLLTPSTAGALPAQVHGHRPVPEPRS